MPYTTFPLQSLLSGQVHAPTAIRNFGPPFVLACQGIGH